VEQNNWVEQGHCNIPGNTLASFSHMILAPVTMVRAHLKNDPEKRGGEGWTLPVEDGKIVI
jgi:hypothetical protein